MINSPEKINLLIVEDDRFILKLYKEILSDIDKIEMNELETAENAINYIKKNKPDIVIMDYRLPGMNGLEATKQIIMAHPETIVLVVSGDDRSTLEEEMLEIGAISFLKKPVRSKLLYFTIMNFAEIILAKKRFRNQLTQESIKKAESDSADSYKIEDEECVQSYSENSSTFISSFENKALDSSHEMLMNGNGDNKSAVSFFESLGEDIEYIEDFTESYDDLKYSIERLETIIDPGVFASIAAALRSNVSKINVLLEFPTISYTVSTIAEFLENNDISCMCDVPMKKLAIFLEDFMDIYDQWFKSVIVNQDAESIHFMDITLMSYAMQIDSIFSDVSVLSEDDETTADEGGSVELF